MNLRREWGHYPRKMDHRTAFKGNVATPDTLRQRRREEQIGRPVCYAWLWGSCWQAWQTPGLLLWGAFIICVYHCQYCVNILALFCCYIWFWILEMPCWWKNREVGEIATLPERFRQDVPRSENRKIVDLALAFSSAGLVPELLRLTALVTGAWLLTARKHEKYSSLSVAISQSGLKVKFWKIKIW